MTYRLSAVGLAMVSSWMILASGCGAVEPTTGVSTDAGVGTLDAPRGLRDAAVDGGTTAPDAALGACASPPGVWVWRPQSPNGKEVEFEFELREGTSRIGGTYLWDEISDPSLVIDEGIVAFQLPNAPRLGVHRCVAPQDFDPNGDGVVIILSEHRGADYFLDPSDCRLDLAATCSDEGTWRFTFGGSYTSATYGRISSSGKTTR